MGKLPTVPGEEFAIRPNDQSPSQQRLLRMGRNLRKPELPSQEREI